MPITSQTFFVIGDGFNGPVHAAVFRPDGYLYVTGAFTTYKGDPAIGICRIAPDGDLDTTFDSSNGFTADADYYPPSQLLPTDDGGVICVLAKTHTKLINGTAVFDRMEYDGTEVPAIVKIGKTGVYDDDFQCGVSVGTTVASATLVGGDRIGYIVVANPTLVKIIRFSDLWEWKISCAMAGAFNDIVSHDERIVLAGPALSASVLRTEPASDTFSSTEWPAGLNVMVTDLTLEPNEDWVLAVGTGGDREGWNVLYDKVNSRYYVGQKLEMTTSFGAWDTGTAMANRGMYQLSVQGTSEWSLRTGATAANNGFEPYQDTTDADGYTIAALALAAHEDGRVFAIAPFGTFRGVAKSKHTVIAVNNDGTIDSDFALGAMVSATGDARVTCVAVSPNGNGIFIGGRFESIGAVAFGYALMVEAETGDPSDTIVVVGESRLFAYTGNGVRGFVFTGFGEGVYGLRADK